MINDIKYIVGEIINGDYEEVYKTYSQAKKAYEDCVEQGLKSGDTNREDIEGFYYIKKITEKIIAGGHYEGIYT